MNDFTKEELIKLQDCVNHQCYTQPFGSMELASACEKLQSMIDNYCENDSNIMNSEERDRKFKIYKEQILPQYGNDPDKVPPYLEPDFNEGWKG